ncbi:MAG: cytochrome c maturation protein CcmE [Fimbriimonadaceae bacterium]|nr:cytochrome c maturation protein CcmE [Fimbriimonadaceae bacterium]
MSTSRTFPKGLVITIIVALVAVSAIVVAFLQNASPYVTVAQAKQIQGDNLHLAGDILKETLKSDMKKGVITFDIRDEKGEVCTVVYKGMPPANMGEATKVVAIGGMKDGRFHSEKMLVKCPSKYEAEAKKV